jgi:hypothetical protein
VFEEGRADGSWLLTFTRNTANAPKSQAAFSFQKGYQNFDVSKRTFRNVAHIFGASVCVIADLSYRPAEKNPKRLLSDITFAGFKIGPITIPLPIRARGWLEFVYLDDDLRVTRGNRGGLFVHTRPPLDAEGRRKLDNTLSPPLDRDPGGRFVIRTDPSRQLIHAEHFPVASEAGLVVSTQTTGTIFTGRTAKELGAKILQQNVPCPVTRLDHALYLGREFQRAEQSLSAGPPYVQN